MLSLKADKTQGEINYGDVTYKAILALYINRMAYYCYIGLGELIMTDSNYKRVVKQKPNGSIVVSYEIQKANCCNCNKRIINKGRILRDYNYNPMEFSGQYKKEFRKSGLWCLACKNILEHTFMQLGYLKYRGMSKLKSQIKQGK